MKSKKVLITGGAGFIGSHLTDELLHHGYEVRILDNLDSQVHGENREVPDYLNPEAELVIGDVRNRQDVRNALRGIDMVCHMAAKVGVGQSMYKIENYTDVNNHGTAVLLEELIENPVEKLLVASSMSVYGEGLYENHKNEQVEGRERTAMQLEAHDWELYDRDGNELRPIATNESKIPALASIYALGKFDQERMCLVTGKAYKFPVVGMRFFNVYGTRQALSNPYTGVLAIFASRYLNNKPPMIFEDGHQQRDFVSVKDVSRACRLALESGTATHDIFNIGSGRSFSVREIAEKVGRALDREDLTPLISGKYRMGDIRHCFADISKARQELGFEPEVNFEEGLQELTEWLRGQVAHDHVEHASAELAERGLTL